MKVPLKWLKEYVDITLPVAELADKLTMAGTEVKGSQVTGGSWANVFVGEIIAVKPHPNADRLSLCDVDDEATNEETITVAEETATQRAEEITDKFLEELQKRNPEGIGRAEDPDFQYAIFLH